MASEFTIPAIIQYAKISQYLAANDKSAYRQLKSGSIIGNLPGLLYMEWYLLNNIYQLNPSSPTLRSTGEYVLSLCGKYLTQAQTIVNNLTQTKPVVTGPSNQSVNVGANATFTITVTSSLSYTVAWYRNGVLIPGQIGLSYTLTNAQLSDSTAQFSAIVTNGAGSTSSATGVLTVTAALSGRFYWGDTDYSADINAGNNDVPYNGTFSVTAGQPLSVQFPSGAANFKYIAVEYPATESTKTNYASPPIDTGIIPNIAFDNIKTIGAVKIIFSRSGNPFSQNTSNPVIFS